MNHGLIVVGIDRHQNPHAARVKIWLVYLSFRTLTSRSDGSNVSARSARKLELQGAKMRRDPFCQIKIGIGVCWKDDRHGCMIVNLHARIRCR